VARRGVNERGAATRAGFSVGSVRASPPRPEPTASASSRTPSRPGGSPPRSGEGSSQPQARASVPITGAPPPRLAEPPREAGAGAGAGRTFALLGWQVLYEQRGFWRNRRRALASFAFPVMFLVIFGAITHGGHVKSRGNLPYIDFYVPGIIAYAVMTIGFSNMAMSIALLREQGIIKRMRATPMPWGIYLAAIVLSTAITVLAASALMLALGVGLYGARVHAATLPALVLMVILGTGCFTTLGIAVSRFITKPDSGMPVLMLIVLPLSFISDVFFPLEGSKTLESIGKAFPLRRLAEGLAPAFAAHPHGSGLIERDVASLLIWSAVGCVLMLRTVRVLSRRD
jgi:ABC-2 type transport system permease protein